MSFASDVLTEEDDEGPVLPRRRQRADTEMDMTPMIDCTFLLLIFFVVSAKIEPDAAVHLPPARYGTGVDPSKSMILTVARQGESEVQVFLADGKVGAPLMGDHNAQAQEIREAVQAAVNQGRSDVLIKAERSVRHRDVSRVAAAAAQVDGATLNVAVLEIGSAE
jgi:biopolymer transport protein ExbD